MRIELYYLPGCPSAQAALQNLAEALRREGRDEQVRLIRVDSDAEARQQHFPGSPTIRIEGVDVEGAEAGAKPPAYGCRVYEQGGELRGWPCVELLRQAIRAARGA